MDKNKQKKLLAVISCMVVQVCVGILYLWSIFKIPVVNYYSWKESSATMVSPIMLMGFVLGNLIGGYLQDKTNPRLIAAIGAAMFSLGVFLTSFLTNKTIGLIFLTYCTLGGLGCGFTYGSILSCLQKWFPKKRGFASGLVVASFATSTVIFGPISQWLLGLSAFGDKNIPYTFLTLSIVFFVFSMLACLFITLPKNEESAPVLNTDSEEHTANGVQPDSLQAGNSIAEKASGEDKKTSQPERNTKNYTPLQAMKTVPFWCIALTLFFINGTWNMVVPMIKDLGEARGLTEAAAVAAVTITGVTNTLGRFSMATLSDKIGRAFTVILLALTTMISALLLTFAGSYFYLIIIAVLAFCYGGPSSTLPAMTTDLYGTKHGGTNYGVAMLGLGISSIVFNLLSIWINNQTASFIIGACTALIATGLMFACIKLAKKNKHQNS